MTGWESFLQILSKFSDLAFLGGIFEYIILCILSYTPFVHSMFFHHLVVVVDLCTLQQQTNLARSPVLCYLLTLVI